MPFSVPLGTRRLTLRLPLLLLAVVGCTLFTTLGFWQWGRGQQREVQRAQFASAGSAPPQAVTGDRLDRLPRYARIRVEGRYDAAHQLLLDNVSRDGHPGYEVLTPLDLAAGTTLMVDRGWLPFTGYHDRLPDVSLPDGGAVAIEGRLDRLPVPGIAAGRVPPASQGPWPRLTSFPTREQLAQALGRPVAEPVLRLDPESGAGFDRRWPLPGIAPERNYSYAIQWWSFAALTLVLFVVLNLEKRR
jgi:surfeit locus 1 family protein